MDFRSKSGKQLFLQTLGIVFLIYGGSLIVGAIKGNTNPLAPLISGNFTEIQSNTAFHTVTNQRDLDKLLNQARSDGKYAMVDVYADWCVSCKVMEKTVFPSPDVQSVISQWTLIKFDITNNTRQHQLWLQEYQLFGPPALVIFAPSGDEIPSVRTLGEISAEKLALKLKSLFH